MAAAGFFSLRPAPGAMNRRHRWILLLHARGRLAQCRAGQSVPGRGGQCQLAQQSVRQLRAVANTALLRAAHRQCQAELQVLAGRPDRALGILARHQHTLDQLDSAPSVRFELYRTTARALLAAGRPADADRYLRAARALSEAHGWPIRLRWLNREFGSPSSAKI